jgi:hypothetical protein
VSAEGLRAGLSTVRNLFTGPATGYIIPVYQRNYAWGAEQIEQLISDVQDAAQDNADGYFLGNLIVTERNGPNPDFVVIDGQQRLTTLHLLLTLLAEEGAAPFHDHVGRLRYQSRHRATDALRRIAEESPSPAPVPVPAPAGDDTGIELGYNVVRQFMAQHINGADRERFTDFLRDRVTLVRAALPPDTDLNRYFEVMNTRGQQLSQVDIVKARLMSRLPNDSERACFAWIWDACADMDSYVQMTLTRRDTHLRTQVFGEDWSWVRPSTFGQVLQLHRSSAAGKAGEGPSRTAPLTLDQALAGYAATAAPDEDEDPENVRFRSTIEFPALLLHVLRVHRGGTGESEGQLDDKQLVRRFDAVFHADNGDRVRRFAQLLLQCRNLFDSFVLKRQFIATTGDDGDWSLQRLTRRRGSKVSYVNTFGGGEPAEEDGDVDPATADVLLLESMLRVTYTSPRTMHWITEVLRFPLASGPPDAMTARPLGDLLRDYTRHKVRDAFFDAGEPTGFAINRIVFTYLDYLLATSDLPSRAGFRFSYRNSIEHFYPQHPDEQMSGSHVSPDRINLLGNLALVSVGANSKFSNSLPRAKAANYERTIEKQSPKLHIMAQTTRTEQDWGDEHVIAHHTAMVDLLRRDLELAAELPRR